MTLTKTARERKRQAFKRWLKKAGLTYDGFARTMQGVTVYNAVQWGRGHLPLDEHALEIRRVHGAEHPLIVQD